MQRTLCDTASFVVRWMFVGGLMGRLRVLRLRKNIKFLYWATYEANIVRHAGDSNRQMQISNTDELR